MEVLGVLSTFDFPFSLPNKLAFRRLPPPPAAFRRPPTTHLSRAPPPQRYGNRRLAVPCAAHPAPPESDEDEARAILRGFLIEHGMDRDLAERSAATWDKAVYLLASKLRSLHESEQQLEIRLAGPQLLSLFTPYLRSVLKEYEDDGWTIGEDGELASALPTKAAAGEAPAPAPSKSRWHIYKRKRVEQLEMQLSEGCPPPHVLLLMDLGLELTKIRSVVSKYPSVAVPAIKQKLDRVLDFLRGLGVCESRIPVLLHRCPCMVAYDFNKETLPPAMALLESKGVERNDWARIISHSPMVLTQGKAKVEALVEYFSEMGLSPETIGQLLTRAPRVIGLSVEGKLRPINNFLLDSGFTTEEIVTMVLFTRGTIYHQSLERNLKPKWEFFLTMGYPRSIIVRGTNYFSYSLEKRIKPRYKLLTGLGIHWSLGYVLTPSDDEFHQAVESVLDRQNKKIVSDSTDLCNLV